MPEAGLTEANMLNLIRSAWIVFLHGFRRRRTIQERLGELSPRVEDRR